MITVALVDDHPVVWAGVASWVASDPLRRIALRGAAATLEQILDDGRSRPDVIVLDLNLAGVSALDQIALLTAQGHRVVAFSQDTTEQTILTALRQGAYAYIAKHEGGTHFVETVVAVAHDRPYVTPTTAGAIWADDSTTRPRLSAQERTALLLWFQGMSKTSVATRMGLSVHTVNQYINRARLKYLSCGRPGPTKAALLARAIEDGLIKPEEVGDYQSLAATHDATEPS